MTYTDVTRRAALQESRALRGWAKAGRQPPHTAPIDFADEWARCSKTSSTSFGKAA